MSATPSLRCGATCAVAVAGFAVKLTSRCALRSNNHGEADDEAVLSFGRTANPQPPRRRRGHTGGGGGASLRPAWGLRAPAGLDGSIIAAGPPSRGRG